MQTITTKYLCPTNVKGARTKATAEAGSVTLGWDHSQDARGNHIAACAALCAKLGWTTPTYGKTICGQNPDDTYTHVFTARQKRLFVWAAMETKICRTYGGFTVMVRIWEVTDGNMDIVAYASWCTGSCKGWDSEVMNALERAGVLIGDEYKGYFSRYEMPIQIVGA
jgi:outer membrane phospholipase A